MTKVGGTTYRHQNSGSIYCFLAALIWGTAFVAQKVGGDEIGPLTFNALRSILGAAALVPLIFIRSKKRKERLLAGDKQVPVYSKKKTLIAGSLCGCLLFAASNLQQLAILQTEVGKAGFLTAMYVVIVPVLSLIFTRRSNLKVWISAFIALAGLYFLSMSGTMRLERVDIVLILCAILFSLHIMCVDHFGADTDAVELSCIQFTVVFLLGLVSMFLWERPDFSSVSHEGVLSLLYAGVFSSGIAYTLQIIGQKHSDPTVASLVLSLESVISAISGFVLLGQTLTGREILGCVLMACAIVLVQLPGKEDIRTQKDEV